jgi:4-azaleucine resistance transporter AzlC
VSERVAERGIRGGVRAVLPLVPAVVAFGISFGVLARAAEMGPVAATVMSATTFAGSAQFAAAGILEAGGATVAAIAAALLLNSRYVAIGISVAPILGGPVWKRLLIGQLVVDESWAIAHLGEGRFDRGRLVGAGLVLYVAWTASTAVGALGAEAFGDPEALGLDAAFPALFLALLWPQLKEPRARLAAGLGALIAASLLPFTPAGVPIVAAAAACLVGLGGRR